MNKFLCQIIIELMKIYTANLTAKFKNLFEKDLVVVHN